MRLLALFIIIPLIEIGLFIQVGGFIGLWPTLAIVIVTAVAGTYLVRTQGLAALQNLQSSFGELRDPTEPLAHGAMILFSGALLLTPGFFTDAIGFLLLVPGVRTAVFKWARSRIKVASFQTRPQTQHPPQRPDVIDGEFEELDNSKQTDQPSGWTRH